jgi:hypothetical protein
MLQSAFRPISNHLTTNWPILWAARLDVALACGLLLLVFGAPIFWLGRSPMQIKWGTSDVGSMVAAITTLMATGALILWVISVGRVYIRGMSPQMSQYPRFIDILLGTVLIITPTVILSFFAASTVENIGFNLWFVTGMAGMSLAFSTMLAFILTTILRTSMRVALLSFFGVFVSSSILQSAITSVVTRWFPSPPEKTATTVTTAGTIELLIALVVIACLIWTLSGTSHVSVRERLITIGFPALFTFTWSINDIVLQWMGVAVLAEKGNGLNYLLTYANPQAAFVHAPLALAVTIMLGEVLSRRWARLTLMPK